MNRDVVLTRKAERQLREIADWYAAQDSGLGDKWFNGIVAAMNTLEKNPERFGLAHEDEDFPYRLHEMLYGVGTRRTHRILFVIREDRVVVYQIRHVGQRDFTNEQ